MELKRSDSFTDKISSNNDIHIKFGKIKYTSEYDATIESNIFLEHSIKSGSINIGKVIINSKGQRRFSFNKSIHRYASILTNDEFMNTIVLESQILDSISDFLFDMFTVNPSSFEEYIAPLMQKHLDNRDTKIVDINYLIILDLLYLEGYLTHNIFGLRKLPYEFISNEKILLQSDRYYSLCEHIISSLNSTESNMVTIKGGKLVYREEYDEYSGGKLVLEHSTKKGSIYVGDILVDSDEVRRFYPNRVQHRFVDILVNDEFGWETVIDCPILEYMSDFLFDMFNKCDKKYFSYLQPIVKKHLENRNTKRVDFNYFVIKELLKCINYTRYDINEVYYSGYEFISKDEIILENDLYYKVCEHILTY